MSSSGIQKSVFGNYNQGDISRFGASVGKQCSCMALTAICWSTVRKLTIWKDIDLDFILTNGDKLYKMCNVDRSLFIDELPKECFIELNRFQVEYPRSDDGFRTEKSSLFNKQYFDGDEVTGLILFINEYCVSILKDLRKNVYIFDSHSRDCDGKPVPDGKSILLNFKSIEYLEAYILATYENCNFFQSLYVKINQVSVVERNNFLKVFSTFKSQFYYRENRKRKRDRSKIIYERNIEKRKGQFKIDYEKNCEKRKQQVKIDYEKNCAKRKQQFQIDYEKNCEKRKQQFQVNYAKNHEKRKQEFKAYYKKASSSSSRVLKFKTTITEGPFYFCVSCNRCLYKRSVIIFESNKYAKPNFDTKISFVNSPDDIFYICKTCDRKLIKTEVPCQSVKNKLELYEYPEHFPVMSKLERVLISQRILFSKVSVMPKGQFPKLKGTICNIPIQTESVCKTLPRSINESNVIYVKLKRKLNYKGHVFSESIRPHVLLEILSYLKEINHLYSQVNVKTLSDIMASGAYVDCIDDESVDSHFHVHENLGLTFVPDETVEMITDKIFDEFEEEDPLNEYRLACTETVLVSKCPHVIADEENIILAPGEGKAPIYILKDEFCEELAHPHLFPYGKFGYQADREIKLTHTKYFNQRLLNYTQRFASDSDYIFFANFVSQQLNLKNKMNIAMKKVCGQNLRAEMFQGDFQNTVKSFVANDEAYRFMNTLKGSPAYWKNMLSDVLAMVKQLGIPSFFLTLSCADLRWNELVSIISKLRGKTLANDEIEKLSYFERCELLNSNPVLLARHFQYRVESFFKEIVLNGPLGKIMYYVIRVEFQARGSPHVHCLLWAESAPTLTDNSSIKEYETFVDSVISANIPSDDSDLKSLVQKFQVHHHSKTCKKYHHKDCRFGYGQFFVNKTIIAKPLQEELMPSEKAEILENQKRILDKVKNYIDTNLNPKKRNFLNPDKDNYNPVIDSVEDILHSLNISVEEYENALSISTDPNDFQIHLKRNPMSCFVNNYFSEGLLAWEANIDLQPVFNHYKAVQYMCAYFSKNETLCSDAMKEALQQSKELDASKYETMLKLAQAYSDNREVSVQEAVYQLMPELWLRKGYPAISFVNTNLADERFHIMKSEDEINEMSEDSNEIFKRNMLDRYLDRPDRTFLGGKFAICDQLCYAEFCANYRHDSNLSYDEVMNDCQPVILNEMVIEENHKASALPKCIPLRTFKESLKCRKVPKVLRYYTPNQHKFPEKYAHHLLMLFYPFRNEECDLKCDGSFSKKLLDPKVLEIVNTNKILFEPNADLVDTALRTYREDLSLNFDAYAQQEDEEVARDIDTLIDDVEEDELNNQEDLHELPPAPLRQPILSDIELSEKIESLNKKQREIFDVVYSWGKRFVQCSSLSHAHKIEPLHIFLTGNGGCGKSFLIKCMYDALNKILSYKGDNSKAKVLLLAPTGVAAININGTTIHTGLGIPCNNFHTLSDRQRTTLRMKLEDVNAIFIDEISMVSAKLLLQTHQRLCEIFGTSDSVPFAGKTVIVSGDLYQLPAVLAKPVFSMDGFIEKTLKLWHNFKLAELNETVRQQGDNVFIDLLNNVRTGSISDEDVSLLESKFISTNSLDYPRNALHIFAENSMVNEHNQTMLSSLKTQLVTIFALDNYPSGVTQKTIENIRDKKPNDTGGLFYKLNLKVGSRVMLTSNVDIEDRLINGQLGTVKQFVVFNGRVENVLVKFDDRTAGKKKEHRIQNPNFVSIKRTEAKFNITKRKASGIVTRTQFPLSLAYAVTVHKVQGLTLDQIVVSFRLEKQRNFNPGQMYVALSRAKTLNGLFLTGRFRARAIVASDSVHTEYQRLRLTENVLEPLKSFSLFEDSLIITISNVRSLNKNISILANYEEIMKSDLLLLTETQLNKNSDLKVIKKKLVNFNLLLNNDENKYKSLLLGYGQNVFIKNVQKFPGFLLFEIKKYSFSDTFFKLLLVYRSHQETIESFLNSLSNLLIKNSDIALICGDFNIDGLKFNNYTKILKNILSKYNLLIDYPTHLDGGLIDHFYAHESLIDFYKIDNIKISVSYSDHDALKFRIKCDS